MIRWEKRFTDLDSRRMYVTLPSTGSREQVTNVTSIGRARYLQLEVAY